MTNSTRRKPHWLLKKVFFKERKDVDQALKGIGIHTVCQEAMCPNQSECFSKKLATFMILGSKCTRDCKFCAVSHDNPMGAIDENEPNKVAEATKSLGLKHVVITSVTRDDLEDGGASQFIKCVKAIKEIDKNITVEILIPDLKNNQEAIKSVATCGAEIVAHNIETVPRLYHVRKGADYKKSLEVLKKIKEFNPNVKTKSSLMLGLGESEEELKTSLQDLLDVDCKLLTLGQYLAPSKLHVEVSEYIEPKKFEEYGEIAIDMGFEFVKSSPYTRSSYMSHEYFEERVNEKKFDVVVIGAGPGGYECASLLVKEGKSVCVIEKNENQIGGTCLNEGCVPAKQYLESALYIAKAEYAKSCGVNVEELSLDIATLKNKKEELTSMLRSGIKTKLKKAEVIYGTASFKDKNTISVNDEEISFDKCVIASGSTHRPHPTLEIDGKVILSSREIFELESLPKKILIIGGGAIGCEFATFFNSVGVEVVLAEFTPTLVPNEDKDVAQTLERELKKKGIKVHVSTNVTNHVKRENSIDITMQTPKEELNEEFDFVLVSIGRMPNTTDLDLEKADVKSDRSFVLTNKHLQTSNPNIYAIGDVVISPALAHMAYNEAIVVANNLTKEDLHVSSKNVPFVTFCQPQVASVGKNEKILTEESIDYIAKKQFYKSSAKAKIKGDDSGFIKLLCEKESGTILGASMVGNDTTELIHQVLIAIEKQATIQDISKMIFAHPTLSESLWEMVN